MAANGFGVEIEALDSAAGKIRLVVAAGTLETQCIAWGAGLSHPSLEAALITFTDDADRAVQQLAEKAEALAAELIAQAERYRAVDTCVQTQLGGPGLLSPPLPFAPLRFAGLTTSFPAQAGPFAPPAGPR